MNPRRHALRGHAAFSRVFASGRRIDGSLVQCFVVIEPAGNPELKVGFAVSSRAYKAVWRNRLRRLLREAFSRHEESLLEKLDGSGMSATMILAFKARLQVDIRRLRIHPVSADIAGICRQLQALL